MYVNRKLNNPSSWNRIFFCLKWIGKQRTNTLSNMFAFHSASRALAHTHREKNEQIHHRRHHNINLIINCIHPTHPFRCCCHSPFQHFSNFRLFFWDQLRDRLAADWKWLVLSLFCSFWVVNWPEQIEKREKKCFVIGEFVWVKRAEVLDYENGQVMRDGGTAKNYNNGKGWWRNWKLHGKWWLIGWLISHFGINCEHINGVCLPSPDWSITKTIIHPIWTWIRHLPLSAASPATDNVSAFIQRSIEYLLFITHHALHSTCNHQLHFLLVHHFFFFK